MKPDIQIIILKYADYFMSDLKLCDTGWFSSPGDVFPGLGLGPLVKHVYVAQMLGVNAGLWILKQNRWSS